MDVTASTENVGFVTKPHPWDPWVWRPSASLWFQRLARVVTSWQPSSELGLDAGSLIETMLEAARRQERWLLHPCLNPLTQSGDEWLLQRDFQLAVWIASHTL